jgi:hypothetical protein
LQAEATVDTTKNTLVIHNGSTVGGTPLLKENLSNANPANLASLNAVDTASDDTFLIYDQSALAQKKITKAELFTNLAYTGTLTGGTGVINIGSGQLYKDASGNVGIGTSSPISRFNVALPADTSGITLSAATNTHLNYIFFGDPDSNTVGRIGYDHSLDAMRLFTASIERMRIDSAGNVGIGTSSPLSMLTLQNASNPDGRSMISWREIGADSIFNVFPVRGGAGLYMARGFKSSASVSGEFLSSYATSSVRSAVAVTNSGVQIFTDPAATISVDGAYTPTERMRIDSAGKILAAAGTNWVGTVSQNGLSSIIERGSNANGEFVKYADGTMIALRTGLTLSCTASVLLQANLAFPVSFANANYALVLDVPSAGTNWSDAGVRGLVSYTFTSNKSTASSSIGFFLTASSTTTVASCSVLAIGRWY